MAPRASNNSLPGLFIVAKRAMIESGGAFLPRSSIPSVRDVHQVIIRMGPIPPFPSPEKCLFRLICWYAGTEHHRRCPPSIKGASQ